MGVAPNNLIYGWIGLTGWAREFGVPRSLQIVHKPEEVVFCGAELVGSAVGDAEEFDGIVVKASFYGPIAGGADLDEADGPFEPRRGIGIGQRIGWNAQQDELGGIVAVVVEAGFQPGGGATFPISCQQPVA